ncbi:TetR/AcrR family transcriptional regulator [Pseudarthrobacter sp. YAF2]|uniref:TetR/AcrR family transcriptional regulator n=1 Tax=Pseudarthrobacter sp. YAF2 TaxID=3233078 RepID=UPI003F9D1E6F
MAGLAETVQHVDYNVRPPLQKRSREAWERILGAGVDLLRQGGYEAFTIAAVCDRAGVPPRAIYARVDTKEGLFLAVYEHGLGSVREQMRAVFSGLSTTKEQPAVQLRVIVRGIAQVFDTNAEFLKPVLLLSSTHPEVHQRGSTYSRELGGNFTAALQHLSSTIQHDSPELALQMCFSMVHSAVVMRTMYGPGFAIPPVTQQRFADELAEAAARYLFAPATAQAAGHPQNE